MIVEHHVVAAPDIITLFDANLLSRPSPKLRDWSGTFDIMWKEALKLWKKVEAYPQKRERWEGLREEILELYEQAKTKEKERESEKDHKTQEFGYRVAFSQGLADDVFARLMFRRKDGSLRHQFRKNIAVHKNKKVRR